MPIEARPMTLRVTGLTPVDSLSKTGYRDVYQAITTDSANQTRLRK
jgi:hypothetical protein